MSGPCLRQAWLLASGLLLLGSLGFAAAWILIGTRYDSLCSPMAMLAALDATLLLHLARIRRGAARAVLAVTATTAMMLIAIGTLISARIGQQLGLSAWESAQRLGLESARLIAWMSLDQADLAWLLAGWVLALVLARSPGGSRY